MSESLEEHLYELLYSRDTTDDQAAISLLESCLHSPSFDINWTNTKSGKWTFLHRACCHNRSELVKELLKHPNIDPNQPDEHQNTPFTLACYRNAVESVELLLNDPRVETNSGNFKANRGDSGAVMLNSGLILAAKMGCIGVVECMLASLRGVNHVDVENALEEAIRGGNNEIVTLLKDYQVKRFETVKSLRIKLKLQEYGPVSIFILVVLLCDGYFSFKKSSRLITNFLDQKRFFATKKHKKEDWRKFFNIMLKLPMELQMLVCNRMFGLSRNNVKGRLVNTALKLMCFERKQIKA